MDSWLCPGVFVCHITSAFCRRRRRRRRGRRGRGCRGTCGRGRRRRKTPFTEPVWRAGSSALSNIRIISMLEIFINGLCGTFNAPIGIAFPARTLVRRVLVWNLSRADCHRCDFALSRPIKPIGLVVFEPIYVLLLFNALYKHLLFNALFSLFYLNTLFSFRKKYTILRNFAFFFFLLR